VIPFREKPAVASGVQPDVEPQPLLPRDREAAARRNVPFQPDDQPPLARQPGQSRRSPVRPARRHQRLPGERLAAGAGNNAIAPTFDLPHRRPLPQRRPGRDRALNQRRIEPPPLHQMGHRLRVRPGETRPCRSVTVIP
jgi:hypothetical protein